MTPEEYQKKARQIEILDEIISEYGDYKSIWCVKSNIQAAMKEHDKIHGKNG